MPQAYSGMGTFFFFKEEYPVISHIPIFPYEYCSAECLECALLKLQTESGVSFAWH